jgi:hypothetical protein
LHFSKKLRVDFILSDIVEIDIEYIILLGRLSLSNN